MRPPYLTAGRRRPALVPANACLLGLVLTAALGLLLGLTGPALAAGAHLTLGASWGHRTERAPGVPGFTPPLAAPGELWGDSRALRPHTSPESRVGQRHPAAGGGGGGGGVGLGPGAGRHPRRHHHHRKAGPVPAGTLLIQGGGDGHGVGMSQYGAEGYALHGASDAAILGHYYTGTALGHVDSDRTVRVLIADGRATFSGASAAGSARLAPARTYTVTASGVAGGLVLRPATGGRGVTVGPGSVTVTGPGVLQSDGGSYRGALQFSADPGGGVRTVNLVGIDDYVRGVVAAEMPSSWAPAALEAQAIAARTYAITTTVDGSGYDLYDDTRSQMYGGAGAETAPTDAAVAATAGQVVTDAGRPAVTYFFASSGGFTESIQNVWPGSEPEPWLVGVPDPYDAAAGDPYHSWQLQLSLAAATAKLGSLVEGALRRIVVTRRGVSPRVISARVIGSGGTTTVTGAQLQRAFGLLSTDMTFTAG